MEVIADVYLESKGPGEPRVKANEGIFTFVAVDGLGRPVKILAFRQEQTLKKSAMQRRCVDVS